MSRGEFCFCFVAALSPTPGLAFVEPGVGLASWQAASFVLLETTVGSFLGSVAGVGSYLDEENYTCLICDDDMRPHFGTMQAAFFPCTF